MLSHRDSVSFLPLSCRGRGGTARRAGALARASAAVALCGVVGLFACAGADAGATQEADGLQAVQLEDRIRVTLDGDVVTVARLRALGERGAERCEVRVVSADDDLRVPVELPPPDLRPEAVVTEEISPSRVVLRGTGPGPWGDLWVDVDYTGDLCRVFDAGTGRLVADDFHSGAWRVRAGRFADALTGAGLQLRVEPVARKEAVDDPDGILLDSALRTSGEALVGDLELLQRVSGTASFVTSRA
jgi:beta-galactosidase